MEDMVSSSLGARVINPQTAAPVRWLLERVQWTRFYPLAMNQFRLPGDKDRRFARNPEMNMPAELVFDTVGLYMVLIGIADERWKISAARNWPASLYAFDHGCTGTGRQAMMRKVGAVSPRPFLLAASLLPHQGEDLSMADKSFWT
ncbi:MULTISPECIES: hypothetical protein [unclassified Rhizobium]|uniref:hypothetical protein n=1 Tax=unclassified Rhizobium TaxID=2613769 RepID=UPI0012E3C2F9|nr:MULTISPECIES: hypothetical protein [unclassified Rhizobium]